MARPKGQLRNSREVLVAAAVENFTALGYHGTSMRDIARTAGVTVASIYHHFTSKQEILQHVMVSTITDVLAMTRAALEEATAAGRTSPSQQLEALVDAWMIFHTTRQAEALIGASEIRSLDEGGRAVVVGHRDAQEALFRTVIENGVAEGVFATTYPREAARAIIEMGYSVASWYRIGGELSPEEMSVRYRQLARGTVGDRTLAAEKRAPAKTAVRRREKKTAGR